MDKIIEILKYIYGSISNVVVLPMALQFIKVFMKSKNEPTYFLVHITSLVMNN